MHKYKVNIYHISPNFQKADPHELKQFLFISDIESNNG